MKISRINHIGIAVNSLAAGTSIWTELLGLAMTGSETVAEQKVTTGFFPVGASEVELLEPTGPESPIAQFIAKKGEGIHHLAFEVEDLEGALNELKDKGVRLIDEHPRTGAGGARIAFIHPKQTGGVLIELCEHPHNH
ncbi:methylmalonyl-CoA epimerase [bacterium]|nr:methylmalonyl-CoA epimerase [bacterium]